MRIAIVGSCGYIASYLIKHFKQDKNISKILTIDQTINADTYLNLSEPDKFDYCLLNSTDFVIFTAAISGPDFCANHFELCWKINVEGTKYFIQKAIDRGCKVLFFSSDAVFGSIPGHIYTEQSETKASTPYGKMKKTIEDEFRKNSYFKAIRLSYVISANDKFISYCLNCVRNNEVAEIFHPFYRNCITISDVAKVITWFLYYFDKYAPFVLNIAGTELISRIRIADELNVILKNRLKYSILHPEDGFFRNRPEITQMNSLYLYKYNILENQSFTKKIQEELEGLEVW